MLLLARLGRFTSRHVEISSMRVYMQQIAPRAIWNNPHLNVGVLQQQRAFACRLICPGKLGTTARPLHNALLAARDIASVGSAAAAGTQVSATPCAAIGPSTGVADAVQMACERLGRPLATEVVDVLLDNWYSTAAELAAMPDETARALGVPVRLRAAVAELLAAGEPSASQAADRVPVAAAPSPNGVPAQAVAAGGVQQGQQPSSSSSSSSNQLDTAAAPGQQEVTPAPAGGTAGTPEAPGVQSATASSGGSNLAAVAQRVAAAASPAVDELSLPIEERRSPPENRFGHSFDSVPKVVQRSRAQRYALREKDMPPALQAEFAAFHRFLTVRFFGAQAEPISEVTARKYADHLRGALGWLHSEHGVPLEELSLSRLLPSPSRDGVSLVFDYILWLTATRDISVRTEGIVIRSACAAAKFLFHNQSRINPGRGEKAYSDVEVVKELRGMANLASKRSKVAPRRADEDLKWLTWPEFLQLCQELRRECAALDSQGKRRADTAVAWSLQRFLIFSILSCVPDRQRTLRELELGRTLVRDRDGRWVIRHGPEDYKTGRSYGERPPLVISPHLYPELDAFIGKWRACLNPSHNLLFTRRNGTPLTDKSLYKMFWVTSFRLTGKRTNPHLVRDMIVTHLRGSGATERELEALAIYMGHSVEMQRDTYDRRTKEQKVEPAVELLASLNAMALAAGSSSDSEA